MFIRDGKDYWVSKKGNWLEVATIPQLPCSRCAGKVVDSPIPVLPVSILVGRYVPDPGEEVVGDEGMKEKSTRQGVLGSGEEKRAEARRRHKAYGHNSY